MNHAPDIRCIPGAKNAIVMIHGICGTPRHFDRFLPYIPENWSIFNVLLDGHGGTPKDFSRTSMQKWKEQIAGLLDEVSQSHSRIVIMGHSMGSVLAMEAAGRYPQVTGLFLLNVPLCIHFKPIMLYRLMKLSFHKTNTANPWEHALKQAAGIQVTAKLWQYLGFLPRFRELLQLCRHCKAILPTLHLPSRVFLSGKDELVSLRSAEYFQRNSCWEPIILPGSGHYYYTPQELSVLTDALRDFLKKEISP